MNKSEFEHAHIIRLGWDKTVSMSILKKTTDQYDLRYNNYGDVFISYQGENEWEYKTVSASELIKLCYDIDFPCEWEPCESNFYSLDSHGQVLGKRIDAMSPTIKELYNYALKSNDSELLGLIASQYGFSKKDIQMAEKGDVFDYEEIYPHLYVSKYGEKYYCIFDTEYRTKYLGVCCFNSTNLVIELKRFSENWINSLVDDIRDLIRLRPELYSCSDEILDCMETPIYGLLLLSIRKGEKQIEKKIYKEYNLVPRPSGNEVDEQLLTSIILEEPETIEDIKKLVNKMNEMQDNKILASLLSFQREKGHLKGEDYYRVCGYYGWDDEIPDEIYKEITD